MAADVAESLSKNPPELPSKYFYDVAGGELFERITRLPEYYPTRTELGILRREAGRLAARLDADELVELGPGAPTKARLLLEPMARRKPVRYLPLEVNDAALAETARVLSSEIRGVEVVPMHGDFTEDLDLLPPPRGRRVVAFLGSTIGNFEEADAARILRGVRSSLGKDGRLLLSTDLAPGPGKTVAELEAAYDDRAGVTAAFNRNLLVVMNRELGANFRPEAWEHHAPWVRERSRIEMHLVPETAQVVRIAALGRTYRFAAGRPIRTEISTKYERSAIERLLAAAGFRVEHFLTDPAARFGISVAAAR